MYYRKVLSTQTKTRVRKWQTLIYTFKFCSVLQNLPNSYTIFESNIFASEKHLTNFFKISFLVSSQYVTDPYQSSSSPSLLPSFPPSLSPSLPPSLPFTHTHTTLWLTVDLPYLDRQNLQWCRCSSCPLSTQTHVPFSQLPFQSLVFFGVPVTSLSANFSLVFTEIHIHYFGVAGLYLCVHIYTCACLCAYTHIWREETNSSGIPQGLSILFLDTGSLKWLGTHQLDQVGIARDPPSPSPHHSPL